MKFYSLRWVSGKDFWGERGQVFMLMFILVRSWGTFMALRTYPCFFKPYGRIFFFLFEGAKGAKTETLT